MHRFAPGYRLRNFILDERIGEGGMGEVWRAHLDLIPKSVAIKVILPKHASDEGFRARFFREATAMSAMRHPRIIPLENFFDEDGYLFLVMPFLPGESLDKVIPRHPRGIPLELIQSYSADILSALDHAHGSGIIHRDIKPQNILVTPNGEAHLMDFGIAKDLSLEGPGATTVGTIIGTPEYMSPEQILAQEALDRRTDIYSFGCVLFQMATGRLPFSSSSPGLLGRTELFRMHLETPPPKPSTFNANLPRALEAVISKALEKDRSQRFDTCSDFRKAIESISVEGPGATVHEAAYARTVVERREQKPPPPVVVPTSAPSPAPTSTKSSRSSGISKYAGLAAAVVLAAAGSWWLVHDEARDDGTKTKAEVPAESSSRPKGPDGQGGQGESIPKTPAGPQSVAPVGMPVKPPVSSAKVPSVRPDPEAEALYEDAVRVREQEADPCRALSIARKALERSPDNPKYVKLVSALEKAC